MPIKATFTGDVTDLRRGTEQARQEFKKVGTEAEGAARHLKAVGSSFDGSKIEGAARRAATSIERIGGVARLTDSEVAKNSRTINELLQKYERMGVEAPANIRKLAAELDHAAGSARKLDTATSGLGDKLKSGFGALTSGLGIGLGAGAGLGAITAIGGALREIAADATKLGPLQQAFERLQGGSAHARDALIEMRSATRGLVSDMDLMRASNQATQLGLTGLGVNVNELAKAAVTLGAAVGNDATTSIDNLIGALGRGSTEVLDNLGITLKVAEAQEIYADRLGKTSAQLTDQEKKQAFVTIAMERAREKAAALGETQLTVAQQAERIGIALGDMTAQLLSGADRTTTLAVALGKVADALDRIRNASPGGIGDAIAREISQAGTRINQAIEQTINNAPWYLRALAETGMAPARLAATAATTVAPLIGNVGLQPMRPLASHGGPAAAAGAAVSPTGPTLVKHTKALSEAQRELNTEVARAFTIVRQADQGWEEYAGNLQLARMEMEAFISMQDDALIGARHPLSAITGGPYQYQISSNMTGGVLNGTRQIATATKDWRVEVRGVAQAFAQLAQIAGPSLNGVTRGIGTTFASVDAASQLIESMAGQFKSLGGLDAKGNFALSGRGRALAGSLAALTTGATLGGMTSNPLLGGLLGAGGGAAAGALAGPMLGLTAGATMGVTAGIGAAAAIYMAWRNRQAEKKALSEQRAQVIASAGGYEQFREAVEDAGFEFEYFLSLFNSNDVDVFTDAMNRLNVAIAENETRAAAMVKGLQEVARVQGVLSPQQIAQIRNMDPNGPGAAEVLAFAEQQRQQAEAGITTAIAALDTATAGGTQQMDEFQASIGAVTGSLVVLFDTAVRNGESAAAVLKRLAEPIQTLQRMLAASGLQPGAGFGQLSVLSDIATGTQTGPLVSLAQGLGQALAGFANTGMLSPDLFAELANGIGEAYHQLELFGKGGLEAARLLQPSLQAIWQMTQDNPALAETLDDTTKSLLDFALQSGLIGEGFRPAVDRMIDALNDLIAKLTEFIDAINGIPKNVTTTITTEHQDVGGTPVATEPPPPASGGTGGDYGTGLAAGGIVTRATRALIGEAGPEAVIPLSRLGRAGAPISITVVSQIDGYEAARAVTRWQPDVYRTYGAA